MPGFSLLISELLCKLTYNGYVWASTDMKLGMQKNAAINCG